MTIKPFHRARTVARWAGVAALALCLSACATVTRGTQQKWTVRSDPAGARVVTSNGLSCQATPCTFKVRRSLGFDVTVSKPGYKTVTVRVKSVNANEGALLGNLLTGGLGIMVDSNNGSLMDLSPNPLTVTLEKDDGAIPAQK